MLWQRIADTSFNLVLLVGIPLLGYYLHHRRRHQRSLREVLQRAGLQLGDVTYLRYAVAGVALIAVCVWWFPPDLAVITREGTVQAQFAGRGLTVASIAAAILYALVQTGFSEEFLFRGLIAGSLARRFPVLQANLMQATIFMIPHLLLLFIMLEHWPLLILILVGSLFGGWLRIRSDAILAPWILHGGANLVVTLSVLLRTQP